MRKKKVKEKQCTRCGEVKPMSEFYTYKYKGRKYTRGFCNACDLRRRRERYREKHPGGLTYDKDTGKLWLRKGRGRSLVWTSQMLSDMRRLFPTTRNEELAGVLGLAVRTVVRKAREMGLEKDKEWLRTIWKENVRMGHMMSRALGYPGGIKKGEHRNPEGEFKAGRVNSEEERRKISEGNKRNWMLHRRERRAKIRRTRGLDDEEVAGQNNELMKVTYDIIRVDGDIEVTDDVPQSDLDLIAEAEKMEWGQIAFRHMEDEAQTEWAKDRIHSMMVRGYRREESSCGCL